MGSLLLFWQVLHGVVQRQDEIKVVSHSYGLITYHPAVYLYHLLHEVKPMTNAMP